VCPFGSFGKRPGYVLSAPQFLCPGLLAVVLRLGSCLVFVSSASFLVRSYPAPLPLWLRRVGRPPVD